MNLDYEISRAHSKAFFMPAEAVLPLENLKIDEAMYAGSVREHLMAAERREARRATESLEVK